MDRIVAVLLIPSYIFMVIVTKRLFTYINGYAKGFNDAKKLFEIEQENKVAEMYKNILLEIGNYEDTDLIRANYVKEVIQERISALRGEKE